LTTLAKAMANGFPVAAVCGREDLMARFKPTGGVEYGGTYNGNPVSMAATLATIEELERPAVHRHLFSLGERLRSRLSKCIDEFGIVAQVVGFGSVFQVVFNKKTITDYRDTLPANQAQYGKFQKGMMEQGMFIIPQANKRCHISSAHTIEDIDHTADVAREVLAGMKP
jgi:glutamate-1-semialdehyde 2,1-aminomutase